MGSEEVEGRVLGEVRRRSPFEEATDERARKIVGRPVKKERKFDSNNMSSSATGLLYE